MKTVEISKSVKYGGDYDVVVCGGGPAGVCAAISAAREGAKTLLVERNGCLGGFWTSGLLTWIADVEGKPGLVKEILDNLESCADGRIEYRTKPYFTADTERTKVIFDSMCLEAGVNVRLYTLVTGVIKEGEKITGVVTDSKSGCEYFGAKVVIDASGDGDVGAFAGCRFKIGNEEGKTQPMTLIALVSGLRYDEIEAFYASEPETGNNTMIYNEFVRAGAEPSYKKPLLAPVSKENNLFALMANHEYGASALSAEDLSKAVMHARKEVLDCVQALRGLGGIWRNIHIVASGNDIGVREGRRIRGKYVVRSDVDLAGGLSHEDGICKVTYYMDIHQLGADTEKEDTEKRSRFNAKPYEIPLRALIAADVKGLMMAGRCISGDFYSYGNYRVGGNAARTGEAAGIAAGYSVTHNMQLEEMPEIIKELMEKHNK